MAKTAKGILFDLGDTLLDFGRVDIRTLFEAGARLSYEYLQKLGLPLPSFARYHRRQLWAVRWSYFKSRFTRREFNSLDVIGRLSLRMGHDLTAEQMDELAWCWYEPLSRCGSVEAGATDMLRRFRDAGLKLGLVSNTFVPAGVLDRHLRQEGLLELLPVRVYSCEAKYRKPDPRIFRMALDQMGLAAEETIFVGDSLEADVAGANHAGMISVLKSRTGHPPRGKEKPCHRIVRLAELEKIVEGYTRS